MKIVTYNIQFGLGKDELFDLERIASAVDGADIIVLQEVERNWQRSSMVDQPEVLAELLYQYYWVYGPFFDVDASKHEANGKVTNVRRQFGNMILSKTPIISTRLFPLPKSIINDQRNMVVGMLEGVVDLPGGEALRIYNTHLSAKSAEDRIAQIHTIRKIITKAPDQGGAWTGPSTHPLWLEDNITPPMPEKFVLLGDFNLAPLDLEYDHLVRASRNECDLVDCWSLTGHEINKGVTFPSNKINSQRIDFAFVSATMQNLVLDAWIDETAQGSDHQPYWIKLESDTFTRFVDLL
ncbi:MAG: endonuclease/exonuclease/phosphatase family protein [Rhizobiaceae bacterium]